MSQCQIFTATEKQTLREGGKILRECLDFLKSMIKPGVTTLALDLAAEEFIRSRGAIPAFKGYYGYPAALCTSVNDEVVHGLPSKERVLNEGDIISVDSGVLFDGLYTDACFSAAVGTAPAGVHTFLNSISEVLEEVIQEIVRADAKVGDISFFIERHLKKAGYSPVPTLTGHGLGAKLHQFPDVPNVGKKDTGPVLPAGTMIAIEPIAVMGRPDVYTAEDKWTVITSDHSLAGHFEHSVLITGEGAEIIA
ncbi:type I methionyl aminopeptidase [Candidatus Peribacteria bacterium RIFCSPLOWO2_02_FULL_51_10]|nr:MAG: type I methionyl aminopeptidase [Candidatus Peribacteria bacterium RIFCSPLOWO2_02_FULL_51_10]